MASLRRPLQLAVDFSRPTIARSFGYSLQGAPALQGHPLGFSPVASSSGWADMKATTILSVRKNGRVVRAMLTACPLPCFLARPRALTHPSPTTPRPRRAFCRP